MFSLPVKATEVTAPGAPEAFVLVIVSPNPVPALLLFVYIKAIGLLGGGEH